MYGYSFYITKKGNECIVEDCGVIFLRNDYEKEQLLTRDVKYFASIKKDKLIPFNKDSVLSKLQDSDAIIFSDLDGFKISGFKGSDLPAFGKFIEEYKVPERAINLENINDIYVQRKHRLAEHFEGFSLEDVCVDGTWEPNNWCVSLNTGLKKTIKSEEDLSKLSEIINSFQIKLESLYDKPDEWRFKDNNFILFYNIRSKVINYFKEKKVHSEHNHKQYKFKDHFIVHMSSLHTKIDGSMYVELHQFYNYGKPVTNGKCTSTPIININDNDPLIEEFKEYMLSEYNCKFTHNKRHEYFFDVL